MSPTGISTHSMDAVRLWTLILCLCTLLRSWTPWDARPLRADPSLQNPGRQSAEDFSY